MNIVKRWFVEFFNPSVKCERLGHRMYDRSTTIMKRGHPQFSSIIATEYRCVIPTCKRCGYKEEPTKLKEKQAFNGVSMPTSDWDEIREKGYLES